MVRRRATRIQTRLLWREERPTFFAISGEVGGVRKKCSLVPYKLYSQYTSDCTFTFMLLHIPNKSTQGSSVADPWHFSADPDVRLTNGSRCGSWRPKIMRILRIRIRNRNTGSQIKSHKKMNKTVPVEIKVFLTSFAWWWWKVPEPDPYLWLTDPYLWLTEPDADPGGPKTYRS